jgi:hypothetical protein
MSLLLPYKLEETVDTRTYEWEMNGLTIRLELRQEYGQNQVIGTFELDSEYDYCLHLGSESDSSRQIQIKKKATFTPLAGRGTEYWFVLYKDGVPITPKVFFRTLVRYPYGRTFDSYRERMTRKPWESRIVLYWEEDVDLQPYKQFLQDTDPSHYLEHIVRSVAMGKFDKMEQAKALLAFLGAAMQHNAVYLNKADSIPAMERFLKDGCVNADIDYEAMLNLELGYTRCGFINGFILAALCRRLQLKNEVFFSNGGHTSAKIWVNGKWYLADPDAFKSQYPLTEDGSLPAIDMLYEGNNRLLLDTVPGWEDTNFEEGWLNYRDGFRVTGYVGGGRYHSETAYVSSWYGLPLAYPPSVPKPLAIRYKKGTKVLLEWIGSYDRDGDFRDYQIEVGSNKGLSDIGVWNTPHTFIEIELPRGDTTYYWRVRARDHHGMGTPYYDKIYYTPSPEQTIEPYDRDCTYLLPDHEVTDEPSRICFIDSRKPDGGLSEFSRLEGFDDVLGQTSAARTELFSIRMGKEGKSVFRLVDPTNYWFNGFTCRSLWVRTFDETSIIKGDWTFSVTIELRKDGFGGERSFPLVWVGERGSYMGIGLILDCMTGKLHFGTNLFGDWRKNASVAVSGKPEQFEIEWLSNKKQLRFYHNGHEIGIEDVSLRQAPIITNGLFISSNPEGELDCLFHHLSILA